MKRAIAAVVYLALVGCASVQPVQRAPTQTASEHHFERNYVLGEQREAFVGDPLVKVQDYWVTKSSADALLADRAAVIPLPPFVKASVAEGSQAWVVGTTQKDGKTYRVVKVDNSNAAALQFLLNDDGTLEGSAINFTGAKMGFNYTPTPSDLHFIGKTVTKTDLTKGWKNFEIVYSGATKESLNLLYREYTPEDVVRPAFTQNLTYDKGSTSLRFRDISIRVVGADNQSLKYVVEQDGMK